MTIGDGCHFFVVGFRLRILELKYKKPSIANNVN